jgi:zinc transporter, ZIP family
MATARDLSFARLHEDRVEETKIKEVHGASDPPSESGGSAATIPTIIGAPSILALLLYLVQTTESHALRRMLICAIPSVMMLFMSLVAYRLTVPTDVMSAFQHLAAGLLISAVSVELVPPLLEAPSDLTTMLAIVGGFAAGIGMLTMLATFCEADEADEDESEQDALARTPRGLTHLEHARRAATQSAPPYPFALVAAVTTDAAVDGLLVGVASAAVSAQADAGLILSLALAVEMGFTGLAYASTLRKQPPLAALFSIVLPPLVLAVGAVVGVIAAAALATAPTMHVALLAFGTSALLYLVTVELLHEAHNAMEKQHIWWVELMFFVGFLVAVVLEKLQK